MLKSFLLAAALVLATAGLKAQACSFSVNDLAMKNLMAAAAANEFGIGLEKVTKTTFSAYGKSFVGSAPQTHCPLQLVTQVRVSLAYNKGLVEKCELSVDVARTEELAEDPMGPVESFAFAFPASSCRRVRPTLRRIGGG